jgi:hypothetical protein
MGEKSKPGERDRLGGHFTRSPGANERPLNGVRWGTIGFGWFGRLGRIAWPWRPGWPIAVGPFRGALTRAIACVGTIAARRRVEAAGTVGKAAEAWSPEATKPAFAEATRTAEHSAADARSIARAIRPAGTTTFDELRKLGELAPAQYVISIGIEPAEQRLQIAF